MLTSDHHKSFVFMCGRLELTPIDDQFKLAKQVTQATISIENLL